MGKNARFEREWLEARRRQQGNTSPTLTLSPSGASVNAGGTATTFTATVQNTTEAVTWTLQGVGALTTQGNQATYTPPASVTITENATITASVTGALAQAAVTVAPADTTTDPVESIAIVSSSLRVLEGSTLETYLGPAADATGTGNLRYWREKAINGDSDTKPSWAYMTSEQRQSVGNQVGNKLPWDTKYIDAADGEGKYWVIRTHKDPDGTSYTYRGVGPSLPANGQYEVCRGLSNRGLSVAGFAYRWTQELRYLSLACMDLRNARRIMTFTSGLSSKVNDGWGGWPYGTNGKKQILWNIDFGVGTLFDSAGRRFKPDPRSVAIIETRGDHHNPPRTSGAGNWLTYQNQTAGNTFGENGAAGTEVELEYSVVMGIMVAGLGAYQNRDKYCPINEPEGAASGRPPAYFVAAAAEATYIYEQLEGKYNNFKVNNVKKTLPLPMSRGILHGDVSEIAAAVCYAKIKGGAAWRTHPRYLDAVRAWKLIAAPWQKAGSVQPDGTILAGGKATYHQYDHPTYGPGYYWTHTPPRYSPISKKDADGNYIGHDSTGELPTTQTSQGPHLATYTRMTNAAWPFLYLEGCGQEMTGLTEEFLERCAVGCLVGGFKHGKTVDGFGMPKFTDGNGAIPVPSGWNKGSGTSVTVPRASISSLAYLALAPWDKSGVLEQINKDCYELAGGHKFGGAIGVAAACAAKRAGKLTPHTAN